MNDQIIKAIKVLKQGGIVIFPTDTAFGIGCRIDDEKAIQKLFQIRKRPETQAAPVLVSDLQMAKDYLISIPDEVKEKLIDKYWPGALTIVLPCQKDKVLNLVRGGGDNLGVRMPNNETALEIIKNVGVPIFGPSANFHGEPTPYKFEDLNPKLLKLVDYVVRGECLVKQASTVIDCSVEPWKILRQGAVNVSI
ncbi:threonylcarbamoyl-AMP synthase [Candidatus Roizmanbacteria bacterium]|nr:threonylcarbamoyl-AMP synthase [Candidatus Roizmanbacteria bacterium]